MEMVTRRGGTASIKKMNKRDRWRKETVAGETIRATKCFGLHNEGHQNIISDQVLLTCMW